MTQFKKGDPVWVKGFVSAFSNDRDFDVSINCNIDGSVKLSCDAFDGNVIPRTDDAPQANNPVHVVKLEATRRTVRTPENDGGLYSEESEDNEITLVTAAGHRIELAPWVVDALRMELSR